MDNENKNYWQGKYEEKQLEVEKLNDRIDKWKTIFGWTFAVLCLLLIVSFIVVASNVHPVGYTPEQVGDLAIKICKELSLVK